MPVMKTILVVVAAKEWMETSKRRVDTTFLPMATADESEAQPSKR